MTLITTISQKLSRAFPRFPSSMTTQVHGAHDRNDKVDRASLSEAALLDKLLVIPERAEPREEQMRSMHFEKGRFLARQERWDDLTQLVEEMDRDRCVTDGGMPHSELVCQGARSDVVALAEHVLIDGTPEEARPLSEAISALEEIWGENRENHVIATIVALAHLDIAWAWRGTESDAQTPARNIEAFELHCRRAAQVLDPFCGIELNSPLVTSTRCALLVCAEDSKARAADDYEDLIDLAPEHQLHIRAMGHHLLPQWYGSYEALELEARRTAARTQDIWGAGAYTWAYFDALLVDPNCAANLDIAFFLDGLRDILDRSSDQHDTNLLAAFAAVSIPQAATRCTDNSMAAYALEQIQTATHWILSDYLHELHPLVWGHAEAGFDNQARVASIDALFKQGREMANRTFMHFFGDQIRKGNSLIFTPHGLYVQQA